MNSKLVFLLSVLFTYIMCEPITLFLVGSYGIALAGAAIFNALAIGTAITITGLGVGAALKEAGVFDSKSNTLKLDDTKYKATLYCKKFEGNLAIVDSKIQRFLTSTNLKQMDLLRYKVTDEDWFCTQTGLASGNMITKLQGEIDCEIYVSKKNDNLIPCGDRYGWKYDNNNATKVMYYKVENKGKTGYYVIGDNGRLGIRESLGYPPLKRRSV
ncbi:hypothetical protein K502DRAFT_127764 [Neoconidiobolus thromboides FSU 785]|nr:hypothetical protein K502DRAFT_127764 [Neoconidiobolus thromboides FSU 785]